MIRMVIVVATCLLVAVAPPPMAVADRAAATAQCEDGTYWYGHERAGACDGHDGVAEWFG